MNQSYLVLGKLLDNRYRVIHHAIFIFLIFFFWFLFTVNQLKKATDVLKLIAYSLTYVTIAYFNIYFLFSRFLMKGRIKTYILLSVLTFIMSYLTQALIYIKDCNQLRQDLAISWALLADMMINAITYCMFIGIGLSVKMIKMWMNSEQRIFSLEQESLKAKLSSLKSQISPHFLFNTFNNLYVLTKTNPRLASEMILGFSDLMRYQLNEREKEKVPIENEIEYIKNFLVLEKLRKDKLDLKFEYDKNAVEGLQIEPLLFVTLIENAVKHGSQQMENPFIYVRMEKKPGVFNFEVTNSKPEVSQLGKEESSGKGLLNLRKRLDLSYPSGHTLELIEMKTEYIAKLQIQLS